MHLTVEYPLENQHPIQNHSANAMQTKFIEHIKVDRNFTCAYRHHIKNHIYKIIKDIMNKYCCVQLQQLEDDSWERGFGLSIINKGEVELFSMDEDGYPKTNRQIYFQIWSFLQQGTIN
jgi:hypothetical protein